ncbi:MAG: beta-galactosidase GalA [Terracidiphilus sp.]|nr:beta-galactosidase GalA [Terracidiphilus sp.]
MPGFNRRELLLSGMALSASSLLTRSAWARAAALGEGFAPALAAVGPRERLIFDFDWKFQLGHASDPGRDLGFGAKQEDFSKAGEFKFAKAGYEDGKWKKVNLPHDWAVELPFVWDEDLKSHGFKPLGRKYPETSVGWYRHEFDVPAADAGKRIVLEFDGALRDVLVFVNGTYVGRNDNAYAPFSFDISDFVFVGGKNCVTLRVDASLGDGWFYEGAGVYRHVWLTKTDALHLAKWESWVRTAEVNGKTAKLELGTIIENAGKQAEKARVRWEIRDAAGKIVAMADAAEQSIAVDGSASFNAAATLDKPVLWSVEEPNLYTAVVTVEVGGKTRDAEQVSFGVRTARFDAEKGFFLNGKPLKIWGTCNHQDHAGVGAAIPDRLQWYRLAALKEMGSNAVRTSHNMPTPEWVEACDRMGMMMMCETRQMSSNPEGLAQLDAMVKRYRNSPSIILWSIGNEENELQNGQAELGEKIAAAMVRRCHELDPTRVVSAAVNGSNEKGVSNALDIIGFNYHLKYPDKFHANHPQKPVYGSETASTVSTRGEYTTDKLRNVVSAYDANVPLWANGTAEWVTFYGTREWTAGGFAWTGFDYRGEPTPYDWPSVNSQFGILDTCGFPKDAYYYYKAWWGTKPVLHVFPHWNFAGKEGEEIPVWVYTNLDEVELVLNGASLGRKKVERFGHAEWKVKYAAGAIEARGFKDGKLALTEKRETTGEAVAIRLSADRTEIDADGEDAAVIKVEALDRQGRTVPTAMNRIGFKVSGAGALIGVGNGDPNCHESDKEPKRSFFNGLAQAIVQATKQPGEIVIEAKKDGWDGPELTPAKLTIQTKIVTPRAAV